METTKRRRSETAQQDRRIDLSSDIYEDALRGGPPAVLHSSWLRDVEWVRSANPQNLSSQENPKDEINSLSSQLIHLKRRLSPAAERCTELFNFYHGFPTTGHQQFFEARRACNPYEVLGEGQEGGLNTHFLNRSAMKLANIDAILDFQLTSRDCNEPFYFADLCGAPGGFSEYVMTRCRERRIPDTRGYAMSLIGTNEHGEGTPWKLQEASFNVNGLRTSFRICSGADNTGDIFNWSNCQYLADMIREDRIREAPYENAEPGLAHLVMADGGFDAQRDVEDQEGVAQKLIVCEVAAALNLLRRGGCLIVKMFGFQTSVTRSVMRELYISFDNLLCLKPITSRPASAERYVVCTGFRGPQPEWSGPRWRDRMFLGLDFGSESQETNCALVRLWSYLDKFDRDMLRLNLKACFEVLSYLENKRNSVEKGTQMDLGHQQRPSINLEAYKQAWRLS